MDRTVHRQIRDVILLLQVALNARDKGGANLAALWILQEDPEALTGL